MIVCERFVGEKIERSLHNKDEKQSRKYMSIAHFIFASRRTC